MKNFELVTLNDGSTIFVNLTCIVAFDMNACELCLTGGHTLYLDEDSMNKLIIKITSYVKEE